MARCRIRARKACRLPCREAENHREGLLGSAGAVEARMAAHERFPQVGTLLVAPLTLSAPYGLAHLVSAAAMPIT